MKLPKEYSELISFYDSWIRSKRITDKSKRRKIWWAMYYASKEGREWEDK